MNHGESNEARMVDGQIETRRLVIRPFRIDDAEVAHAWLGDPDVMSHMPAGTDPSLERTRQRIVTYIDHHEKHGFSKWLILDRISGEAVGDAGLLVLNDSGNIDLGFRLARRFWGQGLATEIASAWVRVAATNLGIARITSIAHPENMASRGVLEKAGFRKLAVGPVLGMDAITYVFEAESTN